MTLDDTQTSDSLVGARPQTERGVERELRLDAMIGALTGAPRDPITLGRFYILQRLGQGGMGTVYSAYDPQLDRKVALKLLRSDRELSEQAHARMRREAHALARLSHPNVVPVHDVGEIDDELFIVMEFVVGQTLRRWVTREQPSWKEILATYLQAGQGLAAAHQEGIVHRDFKPDNVLRGEDGRVRILDFGLARGVEASPASSERSRSTQASAPDPSSASSTEGPVSVYADTQVNDGSSSSNAVSSREDLEDTQGDTITAAPRLPSDLSAGSRPPSSSGLSERLTMTGAVMGTPAYMAPEQFLGSEVGPAADQYAFCAALFEALYGARPLSGRNITELRENVLLGRIQEPPRSAGVPRWILPILRRGLSVDAKARFESMAALVAELGRDRFKNRRRALTVGAALTLALSTGIAAYSYRGASVVEPPSCTGADELSAEVWSPARRDELEQVLLGTGRDYAHEILPRLEERLSSYADAWAEMYGEACETHLRKEQSDAVYDKRSVCLTRRLAALDSAVEVLLETDAQTLGKAVDVVEQLPSLARCADLEALDAEVAPPEDPALAMQVSELRRAQIEAEAREHAGRLDQARERLDELLEAAEPLEYAPLLAELELARGRVLTNLDVFKPALVAFERASVLGVEAGDDRLALEALARHVYAAARASSQPQPLARLEFAEALARRTPASDFAHALLLNNVGVAHMSGGKTERAREAFERADELRTRAELDELELYWISSNLALVSEDPERAAELAERSAEGFANKLGPNHPESLSTALAATHFLTSAAQLRSQRGELCSRYLRFHPDQGAAIDCQQSLAVLAFILEDDAARESFDAARTLAENSSSYDAKLSASLAGAFVALLEDERDAAEAEAGFAALFEQLGPLESQWWSYRYSAPARLGLARSLGERGQHEQALIPLEAALEQLREISELSTDADIQLLLAATRWQLARSLEAAGTKDDARARELAADALQWFEAAGPGYEKVRARIKAWRAP